VRLDDRKASPRREALPAGREPKLETKKTADGPPPPPPFAMRPTEDEPRRLVGVIAERSGALIHCFGVKTDQRPAKAARLSLRYPPRSRDLQPRRLGKQAARGGIHK
jgi:hypothetical protein